MGCSLPWWLVIYALIIDSSIFPIEEFISYRKLWYYCVSCSPISRTGWLLEVSKAERAFEAWTFAQFSDFRDFHFVFHHQLLIFIICLASRILLNALSLIHTQYEVKKVYLLLIFFFLDITSVKAWNDISVVLIDIWAFMFRI